MISHIDNDHNKPKYSWFNVGLTADIKRIITIIMKQTLNIRRMLEIQQKEQIKKLRYVKTTINTCLQINEPVVNKLHVQQHSD